MTEEMDEVESFERVYDIVVFGATGFTGQFVVEEIARTADEFNGLKWAIAGRNMKKLQGVLRTASKHTGRDLEELPILIADVAVQQSLVDMAQQSKLVLNCVGPYRFHGAQVVRACIEGKASHIDISGEPGFLEKVQMLYNKPASEAGVYIVGACGFDSIPAEMGLQYTQDNFPGDLNTVEGFLTFHTGPEGGAAHYGTWQSAIHGFGDQKNTALQRKQLLGPNPLPKPSHKLKRRGNIFTCDEVAGYCLPFPGSDRSIVYRTQVYNYKQRQERPVQFSAYFTLPSLFSTVLTVFVGAIFGLFASFAIGRKLLETFPRVFSLGMFSHKGPTRKQIAGTSFSYKFIGQGHSSRVTDISEQHPTAPSQTIVTKVTGPEPGYITTPICMVQCAYTLLNEASSLPSGGGVYTAGAAFAKTKLIERLQKFNIKFSLISQPEKQAQEVAESLPVTEQCSEPPLVKEEESKSLSQELAEATEKEVPTVESLFEKEVPVESLSVTEDTSELLSSE